MRPGYAPFCALFAAASAAGCASVGAENAGPAPASRLEWLAANLATELDATLAGDPRLIAAHPHLLRIAAVAAAAGASAAIPEPEAPLWRVAMLDAPEDADAGPPLLAPVAAGPLSLVPPPEPVMLALGAFSDARLARVFWDELQASELAALTGLQAFIAPGAEGVMLMAGPAIPPEEAEARCLGLSAWGVACAGAVAPRAARALGEGGAG